jgi:hypothetical protein
MSAESKSTADEINELNEALERYNSRRPKLDMEDVQSLLSKAADIMNLALAAQCAPSGCGFRYAIVAIFDTRKCDCGEPGSGKRGNRLLITNAEDKEQLLSLTDGLADSILLSGKIKE